MFPLTYCHVKKYDNPTADGIKVFKAGITSVDHHFALLDAIYH